MIAEIYSKVYNTGKSDFLVLWKSKHPAGTFFVCIEMLYRTRDGDFFLHGEGGPLSPYAGKDPKTGPIPGEKIRPLTRDEARAWMIERKRNPVLMRQLFG